MKKRHVALLFSIFFLFNNTYGSEIWLQTSKRQPGRDWSEFVYPKITIVDKDYGQTQGSQLVHDNFPDLEGSIKEIAKGVCKLLYKNISEVPYFQELQFELEYRDGVAYKAGNPPKITVNMSTKHLENIYGSLGDEGIKYEISGINWHELTHAYQYIPKNCGGYSSGTEFFGFIEGTADAVRILAGYHNTRKPSPGGSWTSGYTTTGFFIEWLVNNYDSDFLYKLNQSCKILDPWSYDAACNLILNKGVQALWDEYQWYLKNGDQKAVAKFDVDTKVVCLGQEIKFSNRSFNNPVSYEWIFEGGTPQSSKEKEPVVTYSSAGTYSVSLKATNQYGSTTEKIDNCITVINENGKIKILTEPTGDIDGQYEGLFSHEGLSQLVDDNENTKYCVKQGKLWLSYTCTESEELVAYSFTSGNDASWRDPQNWILKASNDGISWTVIDEKSDEEFSGRQETNLYTIKSDNSYKYYSWEIEAKNDTIFQLAEIEMYGLKRPTGLYSFNKGGTLTQKLINSILYLNIPEDYEGRSLSVYDLKGARVLEISLAKKGQHISLEKLLDISKGFYIMEVHMKNRANNKNSIKREQLILR